MRSKREYYLRNREVILARRRLHYAQHREETLEVMRAYTSAHKADKRNYDMEYRKVHREEIRLWQETYRKANPEKYAAYGKVYRQKNKDKHNKDNAAWARNHRGSRNHWAMKRNTQKLKATPPWSDLPAIRKVYEESDRRTKATGIAYSVDHIWPIQGVGFCGLHVPWNLQIITKAQNSAKGNKPPIKVK